VFLVLYPNGSRILKEWPFQEMQELHYVDDGDGDCDCDFNFGNCPLPMPWELAG
jgi:hypothetical protein